MPPELLSLLGILLILLLVMGGCYLFTRWAGTGLGGRFGMTRGGPRLQVLERLQVGRDQSLLVVKVAGRHFLLGASAAGFSLLAELTEEEGALWAPAAAPAEKTSVDFREMLRKLREKK